mmetsp:Transcript_11046/g.14505  ORF Transcript_11046/g.14505 Transcript_11046/m.14505 type:complete len:84 (+) Transcript_11046:125-376(+)
MKHVLSILAITFLSINVASAALNSGEANYSSGISPITMTPKGSVSIEKYPVLTGPNFMESRLYINEINPKIGLIPTELMHSAT